MANLRQLTPREVLFVGGETANIYQHTGGLVMLDSGGDPNFNFETFRSHMIERLGKIPHFRWKLHEVPLGLDLPYWVEDEKFSFDNHIRRIAVPSPGDEQALGELVSYLYSRHLDRSRPLWETWFIEGLPKGKFALLQKLHHCMIDGEGANKLGEATCDFEPGAKPRPLDPAIAGARAGDVPAVWQQSLTAARRLSRLPLLASREILDMSWRSVRKQVAASGKRDAKPPAPLASFNGDIGSDRGFVFGSLPLADIKAVKNHFGVTVNDMMLALMSGTLRDYLLAQGALPEESLRTSIAVSMRTDKDDDFSNRITTAAVSLATNIAAPTQRLLAIAAESARAKQEAREGGKGVMERIQILPPLLINAILTMAPPDQMIEVMRLNLLVSTVRGSARPMYMGGARTTAMYPISIITPGAGINITAISYTEQFDVGITIDPDLVPNPWRLIEGLHQALAAYLALTQKKKTRKKAVPAKATAARKKRSPTRKKG